MCRLFSPGNACPGVDSIVSLSPNGKSSKNIRAWGHRYPMNGIYQCRSRECIVRIPLWTRCELDYSRAQSYTKWPVSIPPRGLPKCP